MTSIPLLKSFLSFIGGRYYKYESRGKTFQSDTDWCIGYEELLIDNQEDYQLDLIIQIDEDYNDNVPLPKITSKQIEFLYGRRDLGGNCAFVYKDTSNTLQISIEECDSPE